MMLNGQAHLQGPCAPEELLRVLLEWKAKVQSTHSGENSDNHLKKFNNEAEKDQ